MAGRTRFYTLLKDDLDLILVDTPEKRHQTYPLKLWVKDRMNLVSSLAGEIVPVRKDAMKIGKVLYVEDCKSQN